MFSLISRSLPLLMGLLLAAPALAERVQFPVAFEAGFIESILRERVFTGDAARIRLNDDGTGCQHLELREPRVRIGDGRIRVRTTAEARAGRAVGGQCLLLVNWRGELEFTQRPEVGDAENVVLRTTSWQALRPDGSPDTLATAVGRWVEQFMPADLRHTRISLAEPLAQLREFLALMAAPADASGSGVDVHSLAIDRVAVDADRVAATLGLEVVVASALPPDPEPVLSDAELAALEQQLDALDAFFTYTVKTIGDAPEAGHASALLEVLIELRRDLVAVLTEPQGRSEDPARALFLDAWERLTPVLRQVAAQQPDAEGTVRLLTFISAGDALRALDGLGPATGIEISSDGLRRLARMLVPDEAADPLLREDGVDAALRRALGFGEPLPPPQAARDATWVDDWLEWLVPAAVAASGLDPKAVERLNNWVPKTRDMKVYLPMVRDVLAFVVTEQLRASELDARYRELFRALVFAAGWQESCWRQFMVKGDQRWPMESRSGDVGLMQVNVRVWRGLYDQHGLRWDIVYNARAGADILEHYLVNYALRHREHETTGELDSLARSTYAAYNGGPSQYARYRRSGAASSGVDVDAVFYEKYRKIRRGNELAVTACFAGI